MSGIDPVSEAGQPNHIQGQWAAADLSSKDAFKESLKRAREKFGPKAKIVFVRSREDEEWGFAMEGEIEGPISWVHDDGQAEEALKEFLEGELGDDGDFAELIDQLSRNFSHSGND